MDEIIPVIKDEKQELSIPTVWRGVLSAIVDQIRSGGFEFSKISPAVDDISDDEKSRFIGNIEGYGAELIGPNDKIWGMSFYMYMRLYWSVWIYLPTIDENPSDLVMFVRVYENNESYRFEVDSVHVP